jgi:hypothetical protein
MHRAASFAPLCLAAVAALAAASPARANGDKTEERFQANLVAFEEVPPIARPGTASLRMRLLPDGTLDFVLTFENLSGPPGAAHIHFGQRRVNGGVAVFFCGGGGKPACPAATSGTVSGTISPADVVGPTAQDVTPGDLETVLEFLRAGLGYANIHTAAHPSGEIRGQVRAFRGQGHWD